MSLVQMVLIAVGLAADAFAVSVAEGVAITGRPGRHTLRVSAIFGGFQAAMPVLGWVAGSSLHGLVRSFDHWIAFALLVLIGGKMILDAAPGIRTGGAGRGRRGFRLLGLGVATSIDAFAVGVTIAMLRVSVWTPALVIGLVTAALCAVGVQAGDRIGGRLGRNAGILGGVVLVGLALKILLEHVS